MELTKYIAKAVVGGALLASPVFAHAQVVTDAAFYTGNPYYPSSTNTTALATKPLPFAAAPVATPVPIAPINNGPAFIGGGTTHINTNVVAPLPRTANILPIASFAPGSNPPPAPGSNPPPAPGSASLFGAPSYNQSAFATRSGFTSYNTYTPDYYIVPLSGPYPTVWSASVSLGNLGNSCGYCVNGSSYISPSRLAPAREYYPGAPLTSGYVAELENYGRTYDASTPFYSASPTSYSSGYVPASTPSTLFSDDEDIFGYMSDNDHGYYPETLNAISSARYDYLYSNSANDLPLTGSLISGDIWSSDDSWNLPPSYGSEYVSSDWDSFDWGY
ncbi:MAG: hypothetical protein V4674_02075 [Patescibacteria group bacterium]